ncbi:MAG: Rpn family recombination-promoting nuclease/putative transposase [Odoribacter sp.]|nr:Rpn family recombination-promoting nuclease/putative transposase [Odoribacter sp.]
MSDYIRFDWAMKRLLRDKANFAVLEGLMTTLLGEKITIQRLLESESNQESEYDKYNRVDILAEDSKGTLLLFEIQNNNEFAYFQRMLFGVSKLVTEYIHRGQGYENIRKVYSINIVYFSLGVGTDTVYRGQTEFRGIHNNELLRLSPFQQETFKVSEVSQLYPEYYILRVNDFNHWSKVPLEQWIYFLNTGEIPDDATAPGLKEARERLKLDELSKDELKAYYRHLDNVVILRDNINTERAEGRLEGRAEGRMEGREEGRAEGRAEGLVEGRVEGRAEGRAEEKRELARGFKAVGTPVEVIARVTGLAVEEIEKL